MPNRSQQKLLDSFIGHKGIYFSTIEEDEVFDLGTKILYLERAISQNCHEFLQSLDRLYDPHLQGEARSANIEFIRALKVINDLCFNNQVQYGEFGTKEALNHFFGFIGDVNPLDFQQSIQASIKARINDWREVDEKRVTEQKIDRELLEANIARHIAWREELDLPMEQRAHQQPFFQSIQMQQAVPHIAHLLRVTGPQYRQLSQEVRGVIAGNTNGMRQLIQNCGMTFANIQALAADELHELVVKLFRVSNLVNVVHMSLAELLELNRDLRTQLIDNVDEVELLVHMVHMPLVDLLELNPNLRTEFIQNADKINILVNEVNLPLADLLVTEPNWRTELIDKADEVDILVNVVHLPLADLLVLQADLRSELIDNANRVAILVDEAYLSLEKLYGLSVLNLRIVLDDPDSKVAQDILNSSAAGFRP